MQSYGLSEYVVLMISTFFVKYRVKYYIVLIIKVI